MALEAGSEGDLIEGADLESPNLNPAYSLRPDSAVRSVSLIPHQILSDVSSPLFAPLSTTYVPPGQQLASLAPAPGQPAGASLAPPNPANLRPPQVAPVIPAGSEAPQVQTAQVAPPLNQPTATPPGQRNQSLRPGAGNIIQPAPDYDPNADLQNELKAAEQERDKAKEMGFNRPFRALLDETGMKEDQKRYEEANKRIGEIRQKIQAQQNNQQLAKNFGLFQKVPNTVDAAALPALAQDEWKNQGNIAAYRGLLATGHAEQAKMYSPEGFEKLGKDTTNVSEAFQLLDNAKNPADYKTQREKALASIKDNPNAANLGFTDGKIPKSIEEYKARRGLIKGPNNDAVDLVSTYEQQQANRGIPQPIANKDANEAVINQFRHTGSGNIFPNTQGVTLQNGQTGAMAQPHTKDLGEWGDDGGKPGLATDMNKQKYEDVTKMFGASEEKGAINKYKLSQDFYKTVMHPDTWIYGAGTASVYDKTGGVFRNVAEAAQGSGTVGFTRQLEKMFGTVGNALNALYTNSSELQAWLAGGQKGEAPKPQPRLTPETIRGFREIAKFELDMNKEQLLRLNGPIKYLGENGGSLNGVGLDKEAQELLQPLLDEATQAARLSKDEYPSIMHGNQRIYLPQGTKGPNVVPAGSYKAHVDATLNNVVRSPFETGAAPVPGFVPAAPAAAPPPGRRSEAAPFSIGNVLQSALGISSAQAAEATPAAAAAPSVPASWGVTMPSAGTLPAVRPPAVSPGGGGPAAPVVVQPSATGGGGGAVAVPNYLKSNPVASTVYTTAHQTATNLSGGNQTVGTNVAAIATSSAASESAFKPHELHDKDQKTGQYAGYGLYGHQGDRLANMQKSAGNAAKGVPDQAILPEAQTAFYTREIMEAAKKDPFIAKVIADPNATAEDLTRVQMRMERPKGYNGPGTEEKGMNWSQRLASTQTAILGTRGRLTSTPQQAEANYNTATGRMMGTTVQHAPEILGTVANVATTPFSPPVQAGATLLGGATGGAIRYGIQTPSEQQTAGGYLGAAGGGAADVLPMTIPGQGLVRMGARAVTAGGVEAGKELIESGGDIPKALTAGTFSALSAGASEMFMLALGKTASGIYKMATRPNQQALENAGEVLATQKPKTMLADGTTVENKDYTIAKEWAEKKGIPPDHLAHAFEEAQRQTSRGQALVSRPGYVEKKAAGRELDEVVQGAGAATPGAPLTTTQKIVSDIKSPTTMIDRGLVGEKYRGDAKQAANLMAGDRANPPTNMGQLVDNFARARTALIEKSGKANNLTRESGDAYLHKDEHIRSYDALGDHVRGEQEKLIRTLFANDPAKGEALISQLNTASSRYRTAVMAGGDDIVKTMAGTGKRATEARNAFNALSGTDESARNLATALVRAEHKWREGGILTAIATTTGALHFVLGPVATGVGVAISTVKAGQMLADFMRQKAANKPVDMKYLIGKTLPRTESQMRRTGAAVGGTLGGDAYHSWMYGTAQ